MPQSYINHRRLVTGYHKILNPLLIVGLCTAVFNVFKQWSVGGIISACLIVWLFVCALLLSFFVRRFALKAQDRAIRAEESLRYYILTGKPLPKQLTIPQINALRFADDDEFVDLTQKAISKNLNSEVIKKNIISWKSDEYRV